MVNGPLVHLLAQHQEQQHQRQNRTENAKKLHASVGVKIVMARV
jgi:hypothetical protein